MAMPCAWGRVWILGITAVAAADAPAQSNPAATPPIPTSTSTPASTASTASAVAPPEPAPRPFSESLSGDWGGSRTALADKGYSFAVETTYFYQGLAAGDGDHDWDSGGRLDAFATLDSGKMGLWNGGGFQLHGEYYGGGLSSNLGGAILPTNTAMKLPLDAEGEFVFTSLFFSQSIGDVAAVRFGKINTLDLLAGDLFFGGWGITRFQNLAFAAPPSGLLPPVIMGGIYNYRTDPLTWTLMVYDPDDRTNDYLPDDLFSEGVTVSLGGNWRGTLDRRTSSAGLTGIYSTKGRVDLNDALLPPDLRTDTKDDSWHAGVQLSHLLVEPRPGVGWGLFARAGVSDGNPNPYHMWVTGGIGGMGLLPDRPQDRWGVGYFYYAPSDALSNAVGDLVDFGDEQGTEAFYSVAFTPWLHVTGDLQVIDPADSALDTAVAVGLRLRLTL